MRQGKQMTQIRRFTVVCGCLSALVALGCPSGPSRVHPPGIDADAAGLAAIKQYDSNGDEALSGDELLKIPGIKDEALPKYDKDGDGSVTAAEITERIIEWQESRVGLGQSFLCSVLLDGAPIEGAVVKFVPEDFLGTEVKAAVGTSNSRGVVHVGIPQEDLPEDLKGINGMQLGLFKVEITHPDHNIAAIYNTQTTLGEECAHDRRIRSPTDVVFMMISQ